MGEWELGMGEVAAFKQNLLPDLRETFSLSKSLKLIRLKKFKIFAVVAVAVSTVERISAGEFLLGVKLGTG